MPCNNRAQYKIRKRWAGLIWIVGFSLLLTACGGGSQAQKILTIGVVAEVSIHPPAIAGFKAGMADLGYVEGKDVIYIYNGVAGSKPEAIDGEIKSLLAQQVDLLFVVGSPAIQAKQAVEGTDIPVRRPGLPTKSSRGSNRLICR
jgi:putative ABC transport system substrate-binding protein